MNKREGKIMEEKLTVDEKIQVLTLATSIVNHLAELGEKESVAHDYRDMITALKEDK